MRSVQSERAQRRVLRTTLAVRGPPLVSSCSCRPVCSRASFLRWRRIEVAGRDGRRQEAIARSNRKLALVRRTWRGWSWLVERREMVAMHGAELQRRRKHINGRYLIHTWHTRALARAKIRKAFDLAFGFHALAMELGPDGMLRRLAKRLLLGWYEYVLQVRHGYPVRA